MDINFIQNVVVAILFSYFIILVFKATVAAMKVLISKIILYFNLEKIKKNVDQEYIDFLKGENNDK